MLTIAKALRQTCECVCAHARARAPYIGWLSSEHPAKPFHKIKLLIPKHCILIPEQCLKQTCYWQDQRTPWFKALWPPRIPCKVKLHQSSPNHKSQGNLAPSGKHHHFKRALALNIDLGETHAEGMWHVQKQVRFVT